MADRLLAARPHFLSHGTALAVHSMTLHPRIIVTVSAVQSPARHMNVQGTEIRVVNIRPEDVVGIEQHRINTEDLVQVSDRERTIVDCLRRPELCGGYAEVDIGTWMGRERIRTDKLVD